MGAESAIARVIAAEGISAMAALPPASVAAVISDPPYGNTNLAWDDAVDWPAFWAAVERVITPGGPIVLFGCGKFTFELARTRWEWFRYKLVWTKPNSSMGFLDANRRPMRAHEDVLVFGAGRTPTYIPQFTPGEPYRSRGRRNKGAHYGNSGAVDTVNPGRRYATDVMQFVVRDGNHGLHPTQKPLALMERLVRSYCPAGGLVADPFCGSGSTGAAVLAAGEGRRFWGAERDKAMARVARKRLAGALNCGQVARVDE